MNCAVCGSPDIAGTVDAETGMAALCSAHYLTVIVKAERLAASEAAARRMKAKEGEL